MSDALFRAKAPGIMNLLMADFALDVESAAAILGNLGHESGGFRFLQEKQPLIPGSAGGYGWAQWTGPRRRAYEAYVERNGFDPASDSANYKWLFLELKGDERAAIPAVKNAVGLEAKVRAFEMAFERAGIKHYESRYEWAQKAIDAYRDNPGGTIDIKDAPAPAKDGEILLPAPVGERTPLDLGRILALLLPLLQHVITDPKLRDTVLPLVLQILGVRPDATKPIEPAKPGAPVNPVTKGSLLAGIAALLGGGALQLNGTIAPPVGETATLPGILTTLAPIAIAAFGGPIGGFVSRILSGISFRKPS
jgi:hypothetical protein